MIAVVGGGVIGLSVAYYLSQGGAEVVLYEQGLLGRGCTWGGAGWISPSESAPVVGPQAIRQALYSLGRPAAPLYLRPALDPGLYRWLLQAIRYCNSAAAARGLRAVAELSRPTFELYDELKRAGLAAGMTSHGLLHVFGRPRPAARSLASAAVMRHYGYTVPDDLLTGTELRELEPTLSRRAGTGYLIGQERHIDPARLTAGLAGLARKAGAEIREQAEVRRLDVAARQVRAVVTGNGPLPVAGVILAGGASCGTLLRPLGIRLPLTAGKGYSFLRRLRTLPRRPVHLGDIKVAVTPFARGLRVAGTMELSGNNETLRRSRARAIARGTAQYFDGWDELEPGSNGREPEELWVGRRPLTPDGLPILDRVHPFENLFIATGHSMLGITLAPASGKALAGYVLSGQRPELLEPFRLRRFASTSCHAGNTTWRNTMAKTSPGPARTAAAEQHLHRAIGLPGLTMINVGGIIGSGWLLGALTAAKVAGGGSLISWLLGAAVLAVLALVHAELGSTYPVSGGTARFPFLAFGALGGFTGGWMSWLYNVTVAPIEAEASLSYLDSHYTGLHFINSSGLLTGRGILAGAGFLLLFVAINAMGVKWLSDTNAVAVIWKVLIPLLTVVALMTTSFHASNFTAWAG